MAGNLYCPQCGHPQPAALAPRGQARCRHCGTSFSWSKPSDAPPPSSLATDEEDIFATLVASPDENAGPLSVHGIKTLPLQSITLGDFQIHHKLGSGGMGAVYYARQRSQNRAVALKVLFRHLALQPTCRERFYREAGAMARLRHPGIVQFYGIGEANGFHYFAMEFVTGANLSVLLRRLGGRFAVADALFICHHCAEALHYAHEHGIVHRDVKPENVLLTRQGEVKITDLGLAKALDDSLSVTETGTGVGTWHFMPPEQALDGKHASALCDIYALGGMIYLLLTGELPFKGESAAELLRAKEAGHFRPARRLNREVPERLDLVLDKMLARQPRYRYQNCADLLADLHRLGPAPDHLGFNVEGMVDSSALARTTAEGAVEILLIHDDASDILLAQEAVAEGGIPSNLFVVENQEELTAFLRREGIFASAPRPDLIFLGVDVTRPHNRRILPLLKVHLKQAAVPVVVLDPSGETMTALKTAGLSPSLYVTRPEQLDRLGDVLQTHSGLSVTVVERLLRR